MRAFLGASPLFLISSTWLESLDPWKPLPPSCVTRTQLGIRLIKHARGGPEMSAKLKVIVADDERVISDTLTIILNKSGFEATAAYSGEEVVEIANAFQPDILVTDVVMGAMNGIEAAILVRDTLPSCRIVLLSGHANTADLLDEAWEQGFEFEVIAKPFPPNELIAYLRGETAFEDSA
jgi:CheY-like chemotaxis protein